MELCELSGEKRNERERKKSAERQTWASQVDFVMALIGCAVGLGNIWRFPYLCYKNGGGAFFIPYFLCFVLAAAPALVLEIGLGQYMSLGVTRAWKLVPVFQGIGFAGQGVLLYSNIYYVVIIAWAIYYMYESFTSELPWTTCDKPWNTDRCYVTGMSLNFSTGDCAASSSNKTLNITTTAAFPNITACNTTTLSLPPVDAVEEFWKYRVLNMSRGIEEPGQLVPGLTVSLLIAWVLVYVCICGGVRWTGKIVYFTALFPYVLLVVMFVRGITLEGATEGIIFYLRPDFSRLTDAQVWMDGCTQIIYSVCVGQGLLVSFGSYNTFNSKFIRNGLIVVTVNSVTSILGGLSVFAVLGFMAHETQQPIEKVVSSGPGLVFLAYPKAVTQMPVQPLWSAIFFLTILFVGLDSQFGAVEATLASIMDRFPHVLYKPRNRMIFVAVFCIICFLLGLPMVTQGGIYIFRILDYYAVSGIVLLAMLFLETFAIGWIFGADRFYDCIEMMLGYRPNVWLKICWKYTSPIIINGVFWFQVVKWKPLKFDDSYEYPSWVTGVGILMVLSTISCVPLVAVYRLLTASGTITERWRRVTTPVLQKHQLHPDWVLGTQRWELANAGARNFH